MGMLLPDTPLDPADLVERLWSPSDLPDARLWQRLRRCFRLFARRLDEPTARHPRADRRGLQRFCDNGRVDADLLTQRARERTLHGLRGRPLIVLGHDTTEVNKVGPAEPHDAGPLRSNASRGYLVHSCVAVDPARHELLGVLDAHAWTRSWTLRQGDHTARAPHRKESIKWRRGVRRAVQALAAAGVDGVCVHAFDREGDVHENFSFARRHRHPVVVRAAQDRLIREGSGRLWAHLASREAMHTFEHEVRTEASSAARAKAKGEGPEAVARLEARVARRPARRTATVEVRFARVTLMPRSRRRSARRPVSVEAILLREVDAPAELEAVDWVLLTTCSVTSVAEALSVVGYYEDRYLIEPVHRLWKSALHLEREAVADLASFRRLLALVMPMASHLAQWTNAAREQPQSPAAPHVSAAVLAGLKEACRYRKLPLPRRAWTIKDVVTKLACLGGYEVRPDRQPGWIVLWRGWRELQRFMDLFDYARTRRKEAPD